MLTKNDIEGLLKDHYSTQANSREREFPIRASALGQCPRKLSSLIALRTLTPLSYAVGRLFEDGTDRGAAIGRAFAKSYKGPGKVVLELVVWTSIPGVTDPKAVVTRMESEFKAGEEGHGLRVNAHGILQVRGHIDIAIVHEERLAIDKIEVKGKKDYPFGLIEKNGAGEEYDVQEGTYSIGLKEHGYQLDSSHFIFENKNDHEWHVLESGALQEEKAVRALAIVASMLNAYAKGGFTGNEGPTLLEPDHEGKLPWQCNYCVIGPRVGDCCPGKQLIDKRKPNKLVPAWEAL